MRPDASHGLKPPSSPDGALPFSSWFALYTRRSDIVLLVLELVVLNCAHMIKLTLRNTCLLVGGSPDAALQASWGGGLFFFFFFFFSGEGLWGYRKPIFFG